MSKFNIMYWSGRGLVIKQFLAYSETGARQLFYKRVPGKVLVSVDQVK